MNIPNTSSLPPMPPPLCETIIADPQPDQPSADPPPPLRWGAENSENAENAENGENEAEDDPSPAAGAVQENAVEDDPLPAAGAAPVVPQVSPPHARVQRSVLGSLGSEFMV